MVWRQSIVAVERGLANSHHPAIDLGVGSIVALELIDRDAEGGPTISCIANF